MKSDFFISDKLVQIVIRTDVLYSHQPPGGSAERAEPIHTTTKTLLLLQVQLVPELDQ